MNMLHGTLIVEKDEIGKAMDAAAEHNGYQEFAQAVGGGPELQVERPVEFSILGGGVTCPTGVTNLPTSMSRAFSHRA